MIRSPKLLTTEVSKAFHHRFNNSKTIKFYPWSEFLDLTDHHKDKIIRSNEQYHNEHRTITFSGFVDFDKNLTLNDPKTYDSECQKRKITEEPKDTIMNDETVDTKLNMTVESAILTQFLTGSGKRLFKAIELPTNGTLVCTVTKDNIHQAKKLSNESFMGSLAQLIPKDRWPLIFADHKSIQSTAVLPSLLLKNNITEWIKQTTEKDLVIDEQYTPKQKKSFNNKLLVFKNYSQAASLLPNSPTEQAKDTAMMQKNTNNKENSPPKQADKNKKDLELWMDTMTKRIDDRVSAIEQKQNSDRIEMTALKSHVSNINTSVQKTQANINQLELTLKQSIDQTVKDHMVFFSKTFEEQLQEKLQVTAMLLEKRNDDRFTGFRLDFEKFVEDSRNVQKEQQAENDELRAMVRQVIINNSDTEITFTTGNGTQTNEDAHNTSFDRL
jgi:hypothetical protein